MSIETELQDLAQSLTDINNAIVSKGGVASETGFSGVALAIEEVPGGGDEPELPATQWGRVWYWNTKQGWWLSEMGMEPYGCTLNDVDDDKLNAYILTNPLRNFDPEWGSIDFNYDYFSGQGGYRWFSDSFETRFYGTTAELKSILGIDVTLNQGASMANFSLGQTTKPDYSKVYMEELQSEAEYLSFFGSTTTPVANGKTLSRMGIKKFEFGTEPTSVSNHFLSQCKNLQALDLTHASFTTIGNNFCYQCEKLNSPIRLPESVTTIGVYFLANCSNFNSELYLGDSLTSIGNGFMSTTKKFNQPISFPPTLTSIGDEFMYGHRDFNQPINISTVGTLTIANNFLCSADGNGRFNSPVSISSTGKYTIGQYFMNDCYVFNSPVTFLTGVASGCSIGKNFMLNCDSFSSTIIAKGVSTQPVPGV